MAKQLPKRICGLCYGRKEVGRMHGEFCKVCKSDHVKIERVRQLAMQKYPKLQKLSTAEFVESLWKRLQKLSK